MVKSYIKYMAYYKEPLEACLKCGLRFGDINKRGNEVKRATFDTCKSCYQKVYSSKEIRFCLNCKDEILTKTSRNLCVRCFVPKRPSQSKVYMDNPIIPPLHIDRELKEKLRRLLNRYKYGTYTHVDHFILLDLYTSIICRETYLNKYETMDMESQVLYMLKDLKEKYDLLK